MTTPPPSAAPAILRGWPGRLRRAVTLTFAGLLILVALVVGIGRELIKDIEAYHAPIERWLSDKSGLQVSFDRVSGVWEGAAPTVRFHHLRVSHPAHPEQPPVTVRHLNVRISLSRSLQVMAPSMRLRVGGANIDLQHDAGRFLLLGMPLGGGTPKPGAAPLQRTVLAWLLARPKVSVFDSHLRIHGLYERSADIYLRDFRLRWEGARGLVDAEVEAEGPDRLRLRLRNDVAVVARNNGDFQGVTWLGVDEGRLAAWLPMQMQSLWPARLAGAEGSSELWLHWFQGALASTTLRFDWQNVEIARQTGDILALDRLSGLAKWQGRIGEFWQLAVRDLNIQRGDMRWSPPLLQVNAGKMPANANAPGQPGAVAADAWRYRLHVPELSFADGIRPVLASLEPQSRLREALDTLQPSGQLRDLRAEWQHDAGGWQLRNAGGELHSYRQQPWQNMPGISNIGVMFGYENGDLLLDFDERDVMLDYPAMFRETLHLQGVTGALRLRLGDDAIRLRSSTLRLHNADGAVAARLRLQLPRGEHGVPGDMGLQVTLRDFDAAQAPRYLPAGIIPEKLLAWLDGALKGGRLVRGDIVFNGPLQKPAEESARSVMLGFQVEDGRLQFLPQWQEPVEALQGDVIVENGRVEAHIDSGRYYGLQLAQSRVWTQRSHPDQPVHLFVQTQGTGDAVDGLRLLRESPLGKHLRQPLEGLALQGPLKASFALEVPLSEGGQVKTQTDVVLEKGVLALSAQRLEITELDMDLHHDLDHGLSSRVLQGRLLGEKISGQLRQVAERGRKVARLDLEGATGIGALAEWLNMPALALASGRAPWRANLMMRPQGSGRTSGLHVESTLRGVAIDAPQPLGKDAAEARPLTLDYQLGGAGRSHLLEYGGAIAVTWTQPPGQPMRGAIRVGGGTPQLSTQASWRLEGHVERLQWSEWQPLVERLRALPAAKNGTLADNSNGGPWWSRFGGSSLDVGHLLLGDTDLGQVRLGADSNEHYVTVSASGVRMKGRATLPRSYLDAPQSRSQDTPVAIYLERLLLPASGDEDTGPEDVLPPPESLDPRLLPSAHVRIDRLVSGERELGRYSMTLLPRSDGVASEDVRFTLNHIDFNGSITWLRSGERSETRFRGFGAIRNVADVMAAWNYTPSLDSESALLNIDLGWQGAPYQFRVARSAGNIKLEVHNGHFLKVSNNAAGRVWGLLNFETWMSRLQLHFNDVSDNEMTFRKIDGRVRIANNRLQVGQLKIDSATLKMRMDGDVDLGGRQLDMAWRVTVPLTRNLMLPAAVVGGLPGAATAYVIDKVLASQIDKLTTLTYDVTGTFDAPEANLRMPL